MPLFRLQIMNDYVSHIFLVIIILVSVYCDVFLFWFLTFTFAVFRYAMKCLDKKRIKMKQGETLALNERIMLSLVSTGVSST